MLQRNVSLKQYVHWQIGGPADYFCEPKNISELTDAIYEARNLGAPIFILGSGTNLLVSDKGFRGLVIRPLFKNLRKEGNTIVSEAGVTMESLLEFAATSGLSGLEWAGGLPGTLGGAIRGNAGAFGGETKDSVLEVTSIDIADPELRTIRRKNQECSFGYRSSIFKTKGTEVVVEATLSLAVGDPEKIRAISDSRRNYRKERHPIEYPNVGSIFKNVPVETFSEELRTSLAAVIKNDPFPVVPTAYLISEANLKGTRVGGVQISGKHPNFIINVDHGTAADVEAAIAKVKEEVKKKFGIMLEEEIMRIGE